MYQLLLKPLLFLLKPEKAHYFTVKLLKAIMQIPGFGLLFKGIYGTSDAGLAVKKLGLNFPNPIGLAAGFDKDGKFYKPMRHLGFGFLELGTVTPLPQDGNERPRLFRLPQDEALINRMGFNNEGVDALVERLQNRPENLIIGGNIGKNKNTPNERAIDDYVICFEKLHSLVDYFVVNVSSPNTPNLRDLQEKEPLKKLLSELLERNRQKSKPKPILLKIAPDLTEGQLNDIVEIIKELKLPGIISTNTTIDRSGLQTSAKTLQSIGNGGLSGRPLRHKSNAIIKYLRSACGDDLVIIGVGGILSAAEAEEKIQNGADLIQIYTGMIYKGPSLIKAIKKRLKRV